MGKYIVVKFFTDLQDNKHPYGVGDVFPRAGLDVSDERLAELSGSNNRQGVPLIKLEPEPVKKAQPTADAPTAEPEPVKAEPVEGDAPAKPKRRRTRK